LREFETPAVHSGTGTLALRMPKSTVHSIIVKYRLSNTVENLPRFLRLKPGSPQGRPAFLRPTKQKRRNLNKHYVALTCSHERRLCFF
uniref:Uncharacterized protein n=1 Tax=Oryzias latipes TaxID=8090 RepID=A0A3P9HAC6_ORYLA